LEHLSTAGTILAKLVKFWKRLVDFKYSWYNSGTGSSISTQLVQLWNIWYGSGKSRVNTLRRFTNETG